MTSTLSMIAFSAVAVFLLCMAVAVVGEVRRLQASDRSKGELTRNSHAPTFVATDLHSGERINSDALFDEVALLFLSPGCSLCRRLVDGLSVASRQHVVLVCNGEWTDCKLLLGETWVGRSVLMDPGGAITDAYRAKSPVVVGIRNGTIVGYGYPTSGSSLDQIADSMLGATTDGGQTEMAAVRLDAVR